MSTQSISTQTDLQVAFFDLDQTLIDLNSGLPWVKSEYRLGMISTFDLCKAIFWMIQYHFGAVKLEHALETAIDALKGQKESDVEQRTRDFYEQQIKHRFRKSMLHHLKTHQAKGHKCVLVTTSSKYLSRCVQETLGLDEIICTKFEVDQEGKFTGKPDGTMCFATGKVILSQAYIEKHRFDFDQCYFYTDSFSDLPLLEKVAHPIVVAPDRLLRKYAEKKGWQVIDD
jgi:HAD superfamily hydrolase (TIGR01490 family)